MSNMMSNAIKNFNVLAINLSINYFNGPTKFIFSNLAKLLDTLVKPIFLYKDLKNLQRTYCEKYPGCEVIFFAIIFAD